MDIASGIAIVTGASSGIGRTFARHLIDAVSGRKPIPGLPFFDELWLAARRGDLLAELAEELAKKLEAAGGDFRIRTFTMDLAAPGSLARLENEVREAGSPVRILINNAGYGTYGPFSEVDLERQLGQVDLNCRAVTELCGRLDPFLANGAMLINVSSLAAFAPLGDFAVYAASKAYVLSFSVALAAEWRRRGIKVSALCPGSVQSEFALVASGGARKKVLHGYDPDRVVDACLRQGAKGKIIIMPRLLWKLKRAASVIAGPVASAFFTNRFMKHPHTGKEGGQH